MQAELIASAVVPLIVGLFNLLVAGYALAAGQRDRGLYAFALGPAGVGLWAFAWFVFVFNQEAQPELRTLGAAGGFLAMSGYALDALRSWPKKRAGLALGVCLCGIVGLMIGLRLALGAAFSLAPGGLALRAGAIAAAGLTFAIRGEEWWHGQDDKRRFGRWAALTGAITGIGCFAFALIAFLGQRDFVDVLLFVILWAELLALGYIVHRRIEVRVLVSRAVSYVLLSVLVAGIAAFVFKRLGYDVDPVVLATTVALALLASALFMGLSGRLTRTVEGLLFPEQARLERALEASRGELAELRKRLERAEKLAIAGELAASVAHEIKNPLAPIKGYAQMLEKRLEHVAADQRAFFEKSLRIIREESDRIDARIGELLALARGDRDTSSRDDTLELNRVVQEAAAVAEAEPGVGRIVQRLDPRLGRVRGNEDEMRGALLNLMKNAAEAMLGTSGSVVEIVTRIDQENAIVEVIDEGPGIGEEEAERVFAPFYTTKKGGTGLGLAIVRSAVEAAGGAVKMSARRDRRGAVVAIELPLVEGKGAVERGEAG